MFYYILVLNLKLIPPNPPFLNLPSQTKFWDNKDTN